MVLPRLVMLALLIPMGGFTPSEWRHSRSGWGRGAEGRWGEGTGEEERGEIEIGM